MRRLVTTMILGATVLLAGCQTAAPDQAASPTTTPASTPAAPPSPSAQPSPAPPPPSAEPSPAPPSPSAEPSPASPTPPASTAPAALRPGDSGPAVLALQSRLVRLGFWLGAQDGRYGQLTSHAVTAFQKAAQLRRDGIAGPATMAALDRASRPRPRSTTGGLVEIDLRHQLLLVVDGGRVSWVIDVSTGSVPGTTPAGHHTVFRAVDGYDPGPLGVLYRPRYFIRGVAVHGYPNVPPYPASHGCVRVTNAAMDWLWANDALPIGGRVWVY